MNGNIVKIQEIYDGDEELEYTEVTIRLRARHLPMTMIDESHEDYLKRTETTIDDIQMLDNLHLGNVKLIQEPVKRLEPCFDEL